MSQSEQVLVVPRSDLFPHRNFCGFSTHDLPAYLGAIARQAFFAPRDQVENDPSLKQIIPYIVVRYKDRVFLTHRTQQGTEARLRDKYSIGLGGHINPGDGTDTTDRLTAGMKRELTEEVTLPTGWRAIPIGALNNDMDAVGQVHFGLVYLTGVSSPDVRVRETSKLTGTFARWEEVYAVYSHLESWSQLLVDGINLWTI